MADENEGWAATAWGGGCENPHKKSTEPKPEGGADHLAFLGTALDALQDEQLELAIVHAKEVAQNERGSKCGGEHSQLAEWLQELLDYRRTAKG